MLWKAAVHSVAVRFMEGSAYLTCVFKLTRANICSFLFSFNNINFWLGAVTCILNCCIWKTEVDIGWPSLHLEV